MAWEDDIEAANKPDPERLIYRATHLGSKRVFYVEAEAKIPSAEFTYVELRASELPAGQVITEGKVVHSGPWPEV